MKKSKLNLEVVLAAPAGHEHRLYRHIDSRTTTQPLLKNAAPGAVETYAVPAADEFTLLECKNPQPWTFYNYFRLSSFLYTPSGVVVGGVVSLKNPADSIRISIEVIDKKTKEVLACKDVEARSTFQLYFEEVFCVKGKTAGELQATATATWQQGSRKQVLTALGDTCAPKPFTGQAPAEAALGDTGNYTHIYPKKEDSPVLFGTPEIHPHTPDYRKYPPRPEIVIALVRLPEKRTDCDYICGFGKGPHGYPFLGVPAKGVITLDSTKERFRGILSSHCILTRCGASGGATYLDSTQRFENTVFDFTYQQNKSVLLYEATKSWQKEFDYPAGWDKDYLFNYELSIYYEYLHEDKPQMDELMVSSSLLFCDCHVPPIRVMYGCLAKNSLILMADGSRKRIDAIQIGERVRTGRDAESVQVVDNIWKGPEKFLYEITAADCTLALSEQHPVLTDSGLMRAGELKAGIRVYLAETYRWEKIASVKKREYDDWVYNLSFEAGNETGFLLVAGGIVVGDMVLQNKSF